MILRRWISVLLAAMLAASPVLAMGEAEPEAVPEDEFGNLLGDDEHMLLQVGDEGGDVLSVQLRLAELCYYSGSFTGHMGEGTAKAVSAFQHDFDLPETGKVDGATFAAIMDAVYRPLAYGASGEDVKRLQTRLTLLGFFTAPVTGNYLTGTQDAVAAFQQKMGEQPTGKADVNTQNLLYSRDARSQQQSPLQAKYTATPAPDGTTPSPTVAFDKKLKKGSGGAAVSRVQQKLKDLCYYAGNVSGSYNNQTINAVKRFQEQNGLPADGVVGVETWDALFNAAGVVPPDATPKPTPIPEEKPTPSFWILVDVNNQVTTVYSKDRNGEYTVVVRQMLCSTGMKATPSDVGDWTLNGRKATWCYFPKWGSHARYWTRINASIAFHSVIYNTTNLMDLSVSSYKKLGKRASHGCIRLTVNDAKWVYDNVPAGTVVTIREDLPADPELRASLKLPGLNTDTMTPYLTPMPTAEPKYISGAQPPLPLQDLKKNNSSEAVFWLQKKLAELGYYKGKCSGTYLDGTVKAVKEFQKDHRLRVTGTADVKTLKVLYQEELATPAPTPVPTPTPKPTATPAPTPTPAVLEFKNKD